MGALISIIWLIGTIASIWFIIRPSSSLPMYATRGRAIATGAVIFVGLPIIGAVTGISKMASGPTKTSTQTTDTGATTDGNSQTAAGAPASPWTYGEDKDAMRGTSTKFAQTPSDEKFPNALGMSEQTTTLSVEKRAKGYEVAIINPNLQFTCNSITDTHVSVKFDDGPVERFDCIGSVGDTFGTAYLTPGPRIVTKLRAAKKVMIEAEVFQRGNVQMTFNVAGLTL
ncbi:MAG TPA: hypothetical protein VF485_05970 [Sphingomonas sp.]